MSRTTRNGYGFLNCKIGKKLRNKKESKNHTSKNCYVCY